MTAMGAQDQLKIDLRPEADRLIVRIEGELDMANAPLLQDAVDRGELDAQGMLVLDLQAVEFMDSTGLRVLLALRERTLERGAELAVTPGSQQVQRLLSLTGVAGHLRTIATADALLA
jgi:anti-sigma B factor antagonist